MLAELACTHTALRRAARRLGQLYDEAVAPTGLKATQVGLLGQIAGVHDTGQRDWPTLQVKLVIDGETVVDQTGGLGAVDPVRPLAWMIDHAVRQRGGLSKGQAITTGSWTGLRYFPPGTRARGEFAGLGAVEATF